jgi:biotin transport system substrate-specific component
MVKYLIEQIVAVTRDTRRIQAGVMRFLWVAGFAGFIAMGAHAKVFVGGPVPYTFQNFFVLLAGALLGPLDAALAVMVYLAMGAAGVPVFASANGATGLAYFSGATGGYLMGFLAAAVFVALIIRRGSSFPVILGAFFGGVAIIHALGAAHLSAVLDVPFAKALAIGCWTFLPFDVIKAGFACEAYRRIRNHMEKPDEFAL